MKLLIIGLSVVCIIIFVSRVQAEVGMAPIASQSIYDFTVKTIDGADKSLADYKGQVVMIVNTASRCGFTPQYAGLEKLYEQYRSQGFVILAFPENDFKNQEPGDNSTIKQFCELKYKTTFPLFAKIHVRGDQMAPLYQYLTTVKGFNGEITWNFNKFLVDRKGLVVARFTSKIKPLSPEIDEAVKKALAP